MRRYFWLLVFLFLLLRLPSLFEPYWYGDEGIYLTLGQGIRQGLTLYKDIHDNKPPALYYLAALGQTVFGFRLLLLLWMIPTIYAFYRLSKNKLATLLFLVLASIPLIEGNIANAEIFMLLPTILGVSLFLSQKYFLSGLFLGIAFTFKVPVAAEFGFLCLWLLLFNFKKLKFLFVGFILPTLFWVIYFYSQNALPEFLYSAFLQNFGYISSWSTGSHSGSVTQGGLLVRLVFFILSLIIIFYLFKKKSFSKNISFLLAWFAAALFGALLSARPYPHYLLEILPPFCLLVPSILKDRRLLLIPLVLLFIILKYKFYFYPTLSYYSNFYFHRNNPKYFGNHVATTYQLASFITQNTPPSDRIFVWGDEPYLYSLANRLPAGKYTVAYHINDFKAHQATINSLKTYLPRLIIYFANYSQFPQLDDFLNTYYLPINQVGSAIIFQLR